VLDTIVANGIESRRSLHITRCQPGALVCEGIQQLLEEVQSK
jgi:hypothetical protein